MPREKVLQSLILKKTDFAETDQIVTLFSMEEGKIRCMVKSSKLPTSKLGPSLQPLFLSAVTVTGSHNLPKVIRVQSQFAYSGILSTSEKISAWFVVSEFLIRSLPDGAPNQQLFKEVQRYLLFLHESELTAENVLISIAQFQIKALGMIGFEIRTIKEGVPNAVWFSMDRGGFFGEEPSGIDSIPVSAESYELFMGLEQESYNLAIVVHDPNSTVLHLVNKFVSYQLEREMKSSKYL